MKESGTIKRKLVQILIGIVSCISIYAENRNVVPINVVSGFDDNPILVGVVSQEEDAHSIQWSFANTREFSVEIPERTSGLTLVLLKRDSIPVVKALTSESLAEAITIEFSEGKSVSGTVVAAKDGIPIPEGLVTVEFDDQLGIPIPEKESVFAWELEEGGTFEIRGLPRGVHTVSVRAPGYMPAEQQIQVDVEGQPPELHFQLTKAHYLRGRIVDWLYKSTVEGTFDVVVSPPESQTAEMRTEFDAVGNFQLGPFAERAVVELVVHTESNLRSRPIEITVPADDLVIEVYKWIRVLGTVLDQESGKPIPEFAVITGRQYEDVYDAIDENGQFNLEICENQHFLFISVLASNYSFWTSESIHVESYEAGKLDLGVIQLKPSYTVRGRVLDRETREPIVSAELFRDELTLGTGARDTHKRRWFSMNQRTTTDSNGAFELGGFPAEDGSVIVVWASGFIQNRHTIDDIDIPVEIELEPTSSISGQVVSLTGEPVAAMIDFAGGSISTEDGNFHLAYGPGTHRIRAFAKSGSSEAMEVTLESGESVEDVRLVITNIGRVHGTIAGLLDEETIVVSVRGVAGAYKQGISNGTYEVFGVPEGSYAVRGRTSIGREMTGEVSVDETLEGQIDFTFTGSFTLSGRLLDGSRGLAEHNIHAVPIDSSLPVIRTRTIRDGSFRFEGLVDGSYHVEVPMHDFTQQVLVHGDTYSDLHVHANRLSGMVLGSGSIEGAEVWLKGGEDGREISLSTTVRKNGSYLLKGIPTGTYTLTITHPDFAAVSRQVDVYLERVKLDVQLDEANQGVEN